MTKMGNSVKLKGNILGLTQLDGEVHIIRQNYCVRKCCPGRREWKREARLQSAPTEVLVRKCLPGARESKLPGRRGLKPRLPGSCSEMPSRLKGIETGQDQVLLPYVRRGSVRKCLPAGKRIKTKTAKTCSELLDLFRNTCPFESNRTPPFL